METIAIIGSGLAGYNLAREIRKTNKDAKLVILSKDDGSYYSKPQLSTAMRMNKDIDKLIIASSTDMANNLSAEILTHTTVTKIEAVSNTIFYQTENCAEKTLAYDNLVLAVGANTKNIPLPEVANDNAISINSLSDYKKLKEKLNKISEESSPHTPHITIVGAGLVGCELANDLIFSGYQIDVVSNESRYIEKLIPDEISRLLEKKDAIAVNNIKWHWNTTIASASSINNRIKLELENGTEISTNLIITAVGLTPNIQLAQDAGIKTNYGIVTNAYLQTNFNNIYAIGDCAEVSDLNLNYVGPINQSVRALAATLLGEKTKVHYPAMPVNIKSNKPVLVCTPHYKNNGVWKNLSDEDGVHALLKEDDKLLGFVLSGGHISKRNELLKDIPDIL